MSNTIAFYNHTRKLFANGEVSLADLKFMLVNEHTFDASHTNISSIEGDEVHGSGWTEGGEAIANASIQVADTDESTLTGDNISVTATGGDIGPADGGVIYDSDSGAPLWYVAYLDDESDPNPQTAGEGTDFNVTWASNIIARWAAPSA